MAKRTKKTERRKLKEECEKLFREIVRRRDNDVCQNCFKRVSGSDCHVSHIIPRSRDGRLAIDTVNGMVKCYNCHLHWWHKHPVESGEWFRDNFANRWEYLEAMHVINRTLGTIPIGFYERRRIELTEELELL